MRLAPEPVSPALRRISQARCRADGKRSDGNKSARFCPRRHSLKRSDAWAIGNSKRLVNTSLSADVELGAGWDACIASLGRSAAQDGIKPLMARGFHKPGDVENRLGYYLGQIALRESD